MAKSLAQLADERANPSGKSTTELTREIMMRKAAAAAAKQPQREPMEDKTPAEYAREKAEEKAYNESDTTGGLKKGGKVKKMAAGGYVRKADGIAQRGKTRGKMV